MVAESSSVHGAFAWVELASPDKAAAGRFYAEVFGWTVRPPHAWFELGGVPVAGLGEGESPAWNSYVDVDDVEAVTARAAGLGGTVLLDAGKLSLVADPAGATIGFRQAGERADAACCWNELASRDVDAAAAFYGPLLGWEFAEYPGLPSRYLVAKAGGEDVGGLMQVQGDAPPQWVVYFAVDDAAAAVARVRNAGGAVLVAPYDTPVGKVAALADAQGAEFSILHKTASC